MGSDTVIFPPEFTESGKAQEKTDLRRHSVRLGRFGRKRDIIVYVPDGYDRQPDRRYPVLYMQDGQNLFDPNTSYVKGKPWAMDQAAEIAIREGRVEPLLIVGINHGEKKRLDEYTPTRDKTKKGGRAAKYLRALIQDIKPFIDKQYRTLPDPHDTGVGGSSLGGLFSLYAGLERPDIFGKVCAMSPSAWWNGRTIIRQVLEIEPKPRLTIWLDTGTNEGTEALEDARSLGEALDQRGWVLGTDLQYTEAEGAIHDEAAWGERVAPMLEFLFPA